MQAVHLRALARRLAQPLREQRMVLAQEGADDEGALQRRQRGDRVPSQRAEPSALGRATLAKSAWRVRKSTLSLPRPRTSLASRCSSSTVACGEPSAPMPAAPNSAFTRLQAVGHVAERGVPVHRLPLAALLDHRLRQPRSLFSASYEKRSRSAIQHSLTASFSSGTTRMTLCALTCTIRLAPVLSCGLMLLRRDSSQVRAL
jgi:hypothetical protein